MNKDVHVFKNDNYLALYNSLTMDVAYIKRKDWIDNRIQSEIEDVLPESISKDIDYWSKIKEKLSTYLEPNISTMYMFLNETCNMYCTYCRYIHKLPTDFCGNIMDLNKGKRQIKKFLTWDMNPKKQKTIVFFGTEVLLQREILWELILYVKDFEKENKLEKTELVIFTNGILLDDKIINFFKDKNVVPIVSVDGWKELHDKARIKKNGEGTFETIYRNCCAMRSQGLKFGISLAVGEHNIDFLPQIVKYFVNEFEPLNIGMNPMEINEKENKEIFFEKYIMQGIEAYKIAREVNISIPQIMRRIRPFVEKVHRIKECPTCGGAIRVYPTGKVGTCSHFVAVNEQCMSETTFVETNFEQNVIIKEWSNRTQFQFEMCRKCEAISLCGGGCVYNAWLQNGNMNAPDYRICTHSKVALEWCIWELFNIAHGKEIIHKERVFVPNEKQRKLIYGKLDETKLYLPLQKYNTFGEIKLV